MALDRFLACKKCERLMKHDYDDYVLNGLKQSREAQHVDVPSTNFSIPSVITLVHI